MDVKSTFVSYILFPLIAVIMAAVMIVLNKKNRIMGSRRLVVALLLTGLALGLPGFFGLLGLQFMPWGYLLAQIAYLLLGVTAVVILNRHMPETLVERKGMLVLFGLIVGLLGIYLFQLVFNRFNGLDYGWLAGSSVLAFFVPPVFWWAYIAMTDIPSEIYTVWYYPEKAPLLDMYDVDLDKLKVLEVELFKGAADPSPLKVKVKAPPEMNFGEWFKKFIDDYNVKFPRNGIHFRSEEGEAYGWIFYLKPSFFRRKQFIDPALSVGKNQVREKYTIFARRVTRLQHEAAGEDRVVIL
ncbi:TssN family type VI secretion system protein [Chitinophaga sp. GCM10012297]|uniref:TssN family type VI secretion system protein n=1 Tax=Chitinophaga chungangae TaxID=2821488 RepID=A0ABS3YGJ2_9BACT|nr:TssN family type VI secretion system protein [Chitinophaga chungangae]MBO9153807.1 TssN family type VI secretion system protein [Chitinophaga chungangae]